MAKQPNMRNMPSGRVSLADRKLRRRQIATRVRECGDVRVVASEFSVSEQTVYRACDEFNVSRHIRERQAKESTLKILAAFLRAPDGASVPSVATTVGVTRQRAGEVLRELLNLKLTREIPLLRTWKP